MRITCKLGLRLVLIIRLNGPRDDGIPPNYADEPDTSVVDVPGNLFQLLDEYLPMKSDSDDDEMSGITIPSAYSATSTSYPATPPVRTNNPSPLPSALDIDPSLDNDNACAFPIPRNDPTLDDTFVGSSETPASRPASILRYPDGLVLQCPRGYRERYIREPQSSRDPQIAQELIRPQGLDPGLHIYHYRCAPVTTQVASHLESSEDRHDSEAILCAYCGQSVSRTTTLVLQLGACGRFGDCLTED
ncbi:hypothetical protein EDD85DRAFT_118104 [Armillaria nabsnona]|nr:hypothetical protein EDD85DRAFT_118104 [Armillaria nabsnona]